MKSRYTLFLSLAVVLLFTYSCKDDEVTPSTSIDQAVCDSLDVTYDAVVSQIINTNCGPCHGGSGPGPFNMRNYTETKTAASGSVFLKAIKHESGAVPMPRDGPKLTDGEILILECWIQNGFKEN